MPSHVVVLVIVFVSVFLTVYFCHRCRVAHRTRASDFNLTFSPAVPISPSRATATATATASATASPNEVSLSLEVLDSLPTFVYASADKKEKIECPVCLMDFKDGEKGRFLPSCLHRFHAECIDMWFISHSTCPLCRSIVHGESTESPV